MWRIPSQRTLLLGAIVTPLALLLLAGCGASDDSVTHIEGSTQTITKPMLNHWMRAVVATDFRVVIGTKAPIGFASEPADYSECAEAAKKVVPRTYTGKLKLSDDQISRKCHLLHQLIREQAMAYLLSAQWTIQEAKEQGVPLTPAELHTEFLRVLKEVYKTNGKFQEYMKERRLVLSDVLYQLKRNVLVTRILPKFKARVDKAGGGERLYVKLALKRFHNLIAKTTCKDGYVMEDCKGYHEPIKHLPAPNVVLEEFVQGITRH